MQKGAIKKAIGRRAEAGRPTWMPCTRDGGGGPSRSEIKGTALRSSSLPFVKPGSIVLRVRSLERDEQSGQ
jgi:hypothetical protein